MACGAFGCSVGSKPAPAPWFQPRNLFAPIAVVIDDHDGAPCCSACAAKAVQQPTAGMYGLNEGVGDIPGRLGRFIEAATDVYAQEPDDRGSQAYEQGYQPTGLLPGGLSAAEWNAMSEAQRTQYLQTNATSDAARSAMIAAGIRDGATGMLALIQAVYAAENARLATEAERVAARQRQRDAIELAQVTAARDIRLAEINAGRPISGSDALSTTNQNQTPPMSTTTKVLIGAGVTVGVLGLGALAYKAMK